MLSAELRTQVANPSIQSGKFWWACFPRKAHSQIKATLHPAEIRTSVVIVSRSLLPTSFVRQNSEFVDGIFDSEHPCKCQKHP